MVPVPRPTHRDCSSCSRGAHRGAVRGRTAHPPARRAGARPRLLPRFHRCATAPRRGRHPDYAGRSPPLRPSSQPPSLSHLTSHWERGHAAWTHWWTRSAAAVTKSGWCESASST